MRLQQYFSFIHSYSFSRFFLVICILIGICLHFFNLNWGAPFYFHPDERNIASSISGLSFPNQLNPQFFAYGSLPIYVIFFTGLLINFFTSCQYVFTSCHVSFEQAIVISRIYSALFATFLIPLGFTLGNRIAGKKAGILAAFLITFSVGVIQFSHFGTFEMWTTCFAFLQLLFALRYLKQGSKLSFYFLALTTGILLSIKISNAVLLAVPVVAIFHKVTTQKDFSFKMITRPSQLLKLVGSLLFLLLYTGATYAITNPYSYLANESFTGSIRYETEVALGTLHVFYTGEFYNSIPILFQLSKVYPFLLSPFIFVVSLIGVVWAGYTTVRKKHLHLLLILVSFSVLFFSQVFLFVKWVRYLLPTLPFIYLILSLLFVSVITNTKSARIRYVGFFFLGGILISGVIFSLSYFVTAFVAKDSRIQARDFAIQTIPSDARILSEVYDLGITPFNDYFHSIELFNFYDLDSQGEYVALELEQKLSDSAYLILPSQRILATRMAHPDVFPKGYAFYRAVVDNKKRFIKLYETPCDIFCQITYLGNPVSRYEGTANVFDRPYVTIYKINE